MKKKSRVRDDDLQLLKLDEVAALLSRSPSTVYRLIDSGRLRVVKLSQGKRKGMYGVRRAALKRFIESNERKEKQ